MNGIGADPGKRGEASAYLRDLGRTIRLVWRVQPVYALAVFGITIGLGFLPAAQLWIWKLLVDEVVLALQNNTPVMALFWKLGGLVGLQAGITVAGSLLGALQGILRQLTGELLKYRLTLQIVEKANGMEIQFFENPRFYDKLQNANQEASYRPLETFSQMLSLGQAAMTLSFMTMMLTRLHWAVVPVIFFTLVPAFLVQNRFGRANYRMLRQRTSEQRRQQYIGSLLTTDFSIKEIRTFQMENHLLSIFKSLFAKFFGETRSLVVKQNVAGFSTSIVSLLGWLAAAGYVILRVAQRAISIGDLTLYVQAISQVQGQIQLILGGLSGLYSNVLFTRNFFEFIALPTRDLSAGRMWTEPITQIEFQDVSFCYPGTERPVLQNISFCISRGEVLALIGNNGAGKTTLIKLLCRLYEPSSGVILINGKNAADYSPRSVQEHMAVIFQDYGRYYFSAKDNIGLGRTDRLNDLSAIEDAARRAGAHSVIDALPDKYQTMLGMRFEGGHELSLGEWQRVALARAYLRGGSAVILDEPTSALDAEAEHKVFEELSHRKAGQITILVSHRFSTVRMVDRILVIGKGRIVEAGCHTYLMEKNAQYARLFRLQAKAFEPMQSGVSQGTP